MKKFVTMAVIMGMVAGFTAPYVIAATTSLGPITVSAAVPVAFDLGMEMKKNDFAGATITAMDFGTLGTITLTNGQKSSLRSVTTGSTGTAAVDVFFGASTQGAPYTITQTGTPMTGPGGATLPAANLIVVPFYTPDDNGGATLPAGASVGAPGSWVGTRTIYTSGPTAAARVVQAFYSITDDPAVGAVGGITSAQAAGAYTGTVTFTLTA